MKKSARGDANTAPWL